MKCELYSGILREKCATYPESPGPHDATDIMVAIQGDDLQFKLTLRALLSFLITKCIKRSIQQTSSAIQTRKQHCRKTV